MDIIPVSTPHDLQELVKALGEATPKSKLLAGGTDLIISMHKGSIKCDSIIDLSGVEILHYIKAGDDFLTIGANTTFTELKNSELVRKHAACLADAATIVGSPQIRNRATLGGNIANASPAGDSLPPLLALDSKVIIINSKGEIAEKLLDSVLSGVGKTTLRQDEAIIGVKIPIPRAPFSSTFAKIGSRSTVTIAKISIAIAVCRDAEHNIITEAKVALGAVGKTAYRSENVEDLLKGQQVTAELADVFAGQLSKEIEKTIGGRSSMPYKKEAVIGLAHQAFQSLFYEL